jgi:hypothetical protein
MTDKSLTLLEIHLDGPVRIGENGLLGGSTDEIDEVEPDETEPDDTSDDSGSGCPMVSIWTALALVGLLVAVGIAAVRLLGVDDPEDAAALDALGE